MVAGVGFEPHDLRVMSPTSYQTALPRGNVVLPTMWLFYQSLIIISDFGADVKCFEGVFRDIFSAAHGKMKCDKKREKKKTHGRDFVLE